MASAIRAQRKDLPEDVRFRVLKILENNPGVSQRELASITLVNLGSVNYCLAALVDKGLVKLEISLVHQDKRRYSCLLTPNGFAEKAVLTRLFLQRKIAEYETLKA